MSLQEFSKPKGNWKQVKAANVYIADRFGKSTTHRVMVYMSTADDPRFGIGLPDDYYNAWVNHRSESNGHNARHVQLEGHAVVAPSFAEVVARLESIAYNFAVHINSIQMQRVILLYVEYRGLRGQGHNPPSFSNAQVLVGLRSGVYWQVNKALYYDDSLPYSFDEDEHNLNEGHISRQPTFDRLKPANLHLGGKQTVIPFTPEAWETVKGIIRTLEQAGKTLLQLTGDATQVQLLLSQGLIGLLSHTPSTKENQDGL